MADKPLRLSLHPASKCMLELDGKSVKLSAAELSALRECFPESGRSPEAVIPREVFRRLFESGIVGPSEISSVIEPSYWNRALPSLMFSPFLRMQAVFSYGSGRMQNVEPAIAMFLQPEFVNAAAQLSGDIQEALARVAGSCAVRGVSFPRERTLALVHEIAWTWLQRRPELSHWITWGRKDDGSLDMSVPDYGKLSTAAPAYPWVGLTLSLRGRRQASREQRVVLSIESLSAVAQLLDVLRGGWGDGLIDAELKQPGVQRVLGAIEALGGFIERRDVPSVFKVGVNDDSTALVVTHMGHASLIVDGGGSRILFDPWLFAHNDTFEKQPLVSHSLGQVDAIFFTHHHADHMNLESLLTLPHDVPVFVPCATGEPLTPRYVDFLRLVGFTDVRELKHGEAVTIADDFTVEAVPFFGEARNWLGFGANCYVISRRGQNVLIHADASPESDGQSVVSSGVLKEIVDRRGSIQAVFGTWWQERSFVCNLSPLAIFSPRVSPKMWLDGTEMCDCPPEFLCELVRIAGAKLLVLYAESGHECFLPHNAMSPYVPSISFLWKKVNDIRKIIQAEVGANVVEAQPYLQVVIPAMGSPYVDRSEVAASRTTI